LEQVKAVTVDLNGEPHIVFQALKTIEIGDELLFDYNDKQSRMAFLKKCPVCEDQGPTSPTGGKRRRSDASDTQSGAQDVEPDSSDDETVTASPAKAVAEPVAGPSSPRASSASHDVAGPAKAVAEPVAGPSSPRASSASHDVAGPARKRRKNKRRPSVEQDVEPDSSENESVMAPENVDDHSSPAAYASSHEVATLARKKNLTRKNRLTLLTAVMKQFGMKCVLTRSMLESWQPSISSENVSYILLNRNMMAANAMCSKMGAVAKARQQADSLN
jgi:hypothetical protein